jgi:hypothetical protein
MESEECDFMAACSQSLDDVVGADTDQGRKIGCDK